MRDTMRPIAFAALLFASCAQYPVVEGRCSPAGIEEALLDACEKWPETCDVGGRLEVFCVDAEAIRSESRCGGRFRRLDACTMWLGTSTLYPARVYVREGVAVSAAIEHEAQHWHLWDDLETNACETHDASCGWVY